MAPWRWVDGLPRMALRPRDEESLRRLVPHAYDAVVCLAQLLIAEPPNVCRSWPTATSRMLPTRWPRCAGLAGNTGVSWPWPSGV
jgi:hypothetical protein